MNYKPKQTNEPTFCICIYMFVLLMENVWKCNQPTLLFILKCYISCAVKYFVSNNLEIQYRGAVRQSEVYQTRTLDEHSVCLCLHCNLKRQCNLKTNNNAEAKCCFLSRFYQQQVNVKTVPSICSRENSHVSNPAQPQCPGQNQIQNQSQRQFQHVKASKSMDLGTTQNQQHTGGVISCVYLLCMVAACDMCVPADARVACSSQPHAD